MKMNLSKLKNEALLGWQFSGFYLSGEDANPKPAAVNIAFLENGIGIIKSNVKEPFLPISIPYGRILDVELGDEENPRKVHIGDKVEKDMQFDFVTISYEDKEIKKILLKIWISPEKKENTKACKQILDFVALNKKLLQ